MRLHPDEPETRKIRGGGAEGPAAPDPPGETGPNEPPPNAHPHRRQFLANATIPPMRMADLAFQDACALSPSLVTGLGLGVPHSEGVGDPLVRGVSLPVDAVGVDFQQDGGAVPGMAG
jgi:hypothetical protein